MRSIMLAGLSAAFLVMPALAADKVPASITAAVSDTARPAEDTARDANRKPAEMLKFAGVKPGAVVMDLMPGGGYFTRLFSAAVGDKGVVYAYIPLPADGSAPRPSNIDALAKDAHYANVHPIRGMLANLVAPQYLDLVWTSQNYHDVHGAKLGGQAAIDAMNKAIFNALKPGGIYIVLDHSTAAGAGLRDVETLHRIDPETVKAEAKAAGFEFVSQSNVLHNATDDHTVKVYDAAIRGKTDQFILKFRKPNKK